MCWVLPSWALINCGIRCEKVLRALLWGPFQRSVTSQDLKTLTHTPPPPDFCCLNPFVCDDTRSGTCGPQALGSEMIPGRKKEEQILSLFIISRF